MRLKSVLQITNDDVKSAYEVMSKCLELFRNRGNQQGALQDELVAAMTRLELLAKKQMEHYEEVKQLFLGMVDAFEFKPPRVDPHLHTDPCDTTDAEYVRIHVGACGNDEGECVALYHARHLFGHWLADLHGAESYETPPRQGCEGVSDKVADTIAGILDEVDRLSKLAGES